MGSRRSYAVSVVVGKDRSLTPQKAQVTDAINRGNARDIAIKSAGLIAKSKQTGDFFYGGLKLLEFIKAFKSKARKLSALEMDEILRKKWASIKKREKIRDDPAVDKAVLDASKEAWQSNK